MRAGQTSSGSGINSHNAGRHPIFSQTNCPGSTGCFSIPDGIPRRSEVISKMSGGAPQTAESETFAERGAPLAVKSSPRAVLVSPPAAENAPRAKRGAPPAEKVSPHFVKNAPPAVKVSPPVAKNPPHSAVFPLLFKWGGLFDLKTRIFHHFCLRTLKLNTETKTKIII